MVNFVLNNVGEKPIEGFFAKWEVGNGKLDICCRSVFSGKLKILWKFVKLYSYRMSSADGAIVVRERKAAFHYGSRFHFLFDVIGLF